MSDLDQLTERGWDVLRLSSAHLQVDIVPGLGGTILGVRTVPDDVELLWRTPWGLRARGAAALPGNPEAVMFDQHPGGWQTLFPNAGNSVTISGVDWGYHGEARITPMDWETNGDHQVIMRARLVRTPFEITKIIGLEGSELKVSETIRNVGRSEIEVIWAHQVAFAPPLLGPETVIESGAALVHPDPSVASAGYDDITPWPRAMGSNGMINLRNVPAADAGETRIAYLSEFDRPYLSLAHRGLGLRVELSWDKQTWPHAWYQVEAGGEKEFPWFGNGYFLALSPGTSWPAHGLHDARRVSSTTIMIEPGEDRHAELHLAVHRESPHL